MTNDDTKTPPAPPRKGAPFSIDIPNGSDPSIPDVPAWTETLAQNIKQVEPDVAVDYPAPDWNAWIDRGLWQTWIVLPPLLLNHDPVSAKRAPYFNAAWCAANRDRCEARVMKTVIMAACEGELGYRADGDPSPGCRVKPLDAVTWALGLVSLDTPPGLIAAAKAKRRRLAAVEALLSDDEPSAPTLGSDDEPVPLPSIKASQVRQAFVVLTAMRCAAVKGGDLPGASQRLLGAKDETVERYIRDGKLTRMHDELVGWAAQRNDRWPRIWAAFRSEWSIPGESRGLH